MLPLEATHSTPKAKGAAVPSLAVSKNLDPVIVSKFKDLNGAPAPPTDKEEQPKMEQTQELSASYSVQESQTTLSGKTL